MHPAKLCEFIFFICFCFQVTPLSKRVYSESNDQEMDIWLQVTNLKVKSD